MDMKTSPLSLLNDSGLLKTDAIVNGQWLAGAGRIDVYDPSNGRKLCDVANLGPGDAEAAIAAANSAWSAWRASSPPSRANRFLKSKVKSPTVRVLSSGSRKRPNASTAKRCPPFTTTAA